MATRKGEQRRHQTARSKGTPIDLREAIFSALSKAGAGDYLVACATHADPRVRAAFLSLVARCVPRKVEVTVTRSVRG